MIEQLLFGKEKQYLAKRKAILLQESKAARKRLVAEISNIKSPMSMIDHVIGALSLPLRFFLFYPKTAIISAAFFFVFRPVRLLAGAWGIVSFINGWRKALAPALLLLNALPKRGIKR